MCIFSELFTIVLDMLSVLIHGTLVSENSEKGDDSKKTYMTLIKKLKVSNSALAAISLGMRTANERRCYIVTTSLIGWAHT